MKHLLSILFVICTLISLSSLYAGSSFGGSFLGGFSGSLIGNAISQPRQSRENYQRSVYYQQPVQTRIVECPIYIERQRKKHRREDLKREQRLQEIQEHNKVVVPKIELEKQIQELEIQKKELELQRTHAELEKIKAENERLRLELQKK